MSLFFNYLHWHYFIAPRRIIVLMGNFIVGAWHQFLISRHFKTLFSSWHRARPSDIGVKKNIGDRIMNFIIDFYIRILAMLVRLAIILTGFIYIVILSGAFVLLYVVWLAWPFLAIYLVLKGLTILGYV